MNINWKDLIRVSNIDNNPIAIINNEDLKFNIYVILNNHNAICGYENSAREIYDIKNIEGKDCLCIINDNELINKKNLDDIIPLIGIVGKIEKNKIFREYFNQGYIYKNDLVYLKTRDLSKEELEKLPLKDKICYIPEISFCNKDYINLDKIEKDDYYTIEDFRNEIKNYIEYNFDENVFKQLNLKNLNCMADVVYDLVDWQLPSSLLDGDQVLNDERLSQLGIKLKEQNLFSIKYWETEYDRDNGYSESLMNYFNTFNKALEFSRNFFDSCNLASLEITDNNDNVYLCKDKDSEDFYFNNRTISLVSRELFDKYLSCWENKQDLPCKNNLLYTFNDGLYIAIDNSTGNCWVEEFKEEKEVWNWLLEKEKSDDFSI